MRGSRFSLIFIGFGLLLILACGGFFVGRATPTNWSRSQDSPKTAVGVFGLPPTVTPTPLAAFTEAPPATDTVAVSASPEVPTLAPPTATPTPVPSPVLPPTNTPRLSLRPGPQLVAYVLPNPLLIDGRGQDWPAALPWYDVTQITYGPENYTGPQDLSGRLRVAWDEAYLYLFWEVTDDVFVQTQRGPFLYEGDSVEIVVDANLALDFYTRYLDFDDYQIGFSPGNPVGQHPEAWLWYPQSLAGPLPGVQVAAQPLSTGYTVEVALPWHRLNLQPYPGLDVGFAASISDNDLPGSALQQTMASTSPFRHLTDPTTWGELLLVSREP